MGANCVDQKAHDGFCSIISCSVTAGVKVSFIWSCGGLGPEVDT